MFIKNTNEFRTQALNLVRHITTPKAHSLLGIHPILSIVCGTDDSYSVVNMLRNFRSDKTKKSAILSVVEYCVNSSIYPIDKTVWAFNDPQNEVLSLKSYLNEETEDLENVILLHKDTYPFIAVEEHHTSEPIDKDYVKKQVILADQPRPPAKKGLPLKENHHSHRTTPTILVPTIALGSLYVLSKIANED